MEGVKRMPLFKRKIKLSKPLSDKKNDNPPIVDDKIKSSRKKEEKTVSKAEKNKKNNVKVVKKKTRLGFRRRKEKNLPVEPIETEKETPTVADVLEETPVEPTSLEEDTIYVEKKPFTTQKKKTIIKKDMRGKPVFLEDTGEKLGTVFDVIYDKDNNLVGYKIKDDKSEAVLSFPVEQFDYHKDGLIFIPGWYNNALKIIEKLEFKDKISPELTALLSDNVISTEELYDIFVKYDDEMADYIDEAKSLREMLNRRLNVLEKQRIALKDKLMDLTEKRLIKDIDRKQFSEDVMEHRRKVNIIDLNIKKCKDLLERLDKTSFGVLGKNKPLLYDTSSYSKTDKNLYEKMLNRNVQEKNKTIYEQESNVNKIEDDSYKEKYFALKAQFEQLEDDYQELKSAVDKLFKQDIQMR